MERSIFRRSDEFCMKTASFDDVMDQVTPEIFFFGRRHNSDFRISGEKYQSFLRKELQWIFLAVCTIIPDGRRDTDRVFLKYKIPGRMR